MAYILFECPKFKHSLNFNTRELRAFREMWEAGISVANMAVKLRRKQLEISLLVVDHIERGIIKERETGGFGL